MRGLILTGLMASCAAPVYADEYCAPAKEVIAALDETGTHVALMANLKAGVVFHAYATERGDWILVAVSEGVACLVAKGEASVFMSLGDAA